ncbi:hypothetical protein [Bosea psychrotolerans]|uniref:Uncharacterized protein n=1 Tax=Bosea psychrotolerans TaxID=1871628 RepID=A0A2S4M129_9HYPH|nr:hypothetical protein [Bosea psychrotolerans]POR48413.1 hypothetical protein CYD53_115161 [Bosea psychrotolerans]
MTDDRGSGTGVPPITGYHLAETVQAGLRGAGDALANNPPAHSALPSQTELGLLARVTELFNGIRQEATAKLNALHAEVIGKREALTAERYETRIRRIESGMRALLNKHGGELEQTVFDALKAKREYEYFNYVNQRSADPKLEKWQFTLAFLVVPLAIESLLNGNFFADASDFGLIGGAATAVIISALNISLGFVMGLWPARYCQHAKASHLFWALPAYAGMIALIVLFNLAVGHYRELLIANPDAASQQVVPHMLANPLGVYELKSIALVLIGCLIAFFSASKGYSAFGSYPGQAFAYKRWRQRWEAVERERRRLDTELAPELEQIRGQVEGFREDCQSEIGRLQLAKASADQIRDRYLTRVAQLRAAKDAAVMQYREANLRVRTDLPPAYFSQGINLPEIDQPAELVDHSRLRALIEDVERQFANMPALIEAKLKDQLALVRGVDLAGEIERLKTRAIEAGREAYEQDEANRKAIHAEFSATPR